MKKYLPSFVAGIAAVCMSVAAFAQTDSPDQYRYRAVDFRFSSGEFRQHAVTDIKQITFETRPEYSDYVDLGLSVMWAKYNVGADSIADSGDMFAWGETQPKGTSEEDYTWANYKWTNGREPWDEDGYGLTDYFTKYIGKENQNVLEPEDDAAAVNMGGTWRMPTAAEVRELVENCVCRRVVIGRSEWFGPLWGYRISNKKDESAFIIIPETTSLIWSSTVENYVYDDGSYEECVIGFRISSLSSSLYSEFMIYSGLNEGCFVRAVCPRPEKQ